MIPINEAPPIVKVFCFSQSKKPSSLPQAGKIARSRVNKDKPAISGMDNESIRIRNMQTANTMAAALKKPYQVRFHPCQLPSVSFRYGKQPMICHLSLGNV